MQHVFFDLDGTLTDPCTGIVRSIQYALDALQQPTVDAAQLIRYIGPPLSECFGELLATTDTALIEKAILLYRERYQVTGLYENAVYPGIRELLEHLRAQQRALYVVTSKPAVYAQTILEHFELAPYFTALYGSELDGTRAHKAELIRYVLAQERLTAAAAVMIGDRKHDALGARANDMTCIGVAWGYGSREELQAAGCAAVCEQPADLLQLLIETP